VGGDHVSNDLACGLKVSLMRGEKLKREHGSVLPHEAGGEESISIKNEFGLESKRVSAGHLRQIMRLRLEEIFQLIALDLEKAELTDYLRAGVFLCGGTSRIPGLVTLAENVFQMNVTPGHVCAINGLATKLDQPEFATAIGLVKFGALKQSHRPPPGGLRRMMERLKIR